MLISFNRKLRRHHILGIVSPLGQEEQPDRLDTWVNCKKAQILIWQYDFPQTNLARNAGIILLIENSLEQKHKFLSKGKAESTVGLLFSLGFWRKRSQTKTTVLSWLCN